MSELSCCRHHQIVFTRQGCDICTMQYALRQLEAERDALREALARPVSDEEYENDANYTAWVCFSNGGIHIADSDTSKALKVWRRSGINAMLAARLAAATERNAGCNSPANQQGGG